MHAETIAIGTELTTGAKLDTNSQWLSLELAALGISVRYHTTVADDLTANIDVFRTAALRADLVIITGGLGPTLDDLTREALAAMAGVPLVLDPQSLETIQGMFLRRGREMPARNQIQAMFPAGADVVPNARGTAPGIALSVPRDGRTPAWMVALPGVPSEMKAMFADWVRPRLLALGAGGEVIQGKRIQCFGLGESAFEELLGEITSRGRDPEVGITVHQATITLRIVTSGPTVADCRQKIAETEALIHQRLGHYVFGQEDDELQHVVSRLLSERGATLATAEAGTGGLLSSWLTSTDGEITGEGRPLNPYLGGMVLPTASIRERLLPATAGLSHSTDLARKMAETARLQLGATWGLAITEIASPGNGEPPLAHVALASDTTSRLTTLNLLGDPTIGKARLAKTALNLLRLALLGAG
jgi:nicotinamide-nucleotide amidase